MGLRKRCERSALCLLSYAGFRRAMCMVCMLSSRTSSLPAKRLCSSLDFRVRDCPQLPSLTYMLAPKVTDLIL